MRKTKSKPSNRCVKLEKIKYHSAVLKMHLNIFFPVQFKQILQNFNLLFHKSVLLETNKLKLFKPLGKLYLVNLCRFLHVDLFYNSKKLFLKLKRRTPSSMKLKEATFDKF